MAASKTSLSAGEVIRAALLGDKDVMARVNKIFPVVADSAELPYISYRRAGFEQNPQKAGAPGADSIEFEVLCFTARYTEGVELAEAVRAALDHATITQGDLRLRSCTLTDSEEAYQDDAFVQQLVFTVNI